MGVARARQYASPMPTPLPDMTIAEALDSIAARTPVPGGGAVAGLVAAVAGALARMVIAFARGKGGAAEPLLSAAAERLAAHSARALELAEEDAAAYASLNRLWTLPRDDPQRRAGWDEAVAAAALPPRQLLSLCAEVALVLEPLPAATGRSLHSDLAIAAILADAAARAAAWNLRVNLPLMKGRPEEALRLGREMDSTLEAIQARCAAIERACAGKPEPAPG
jgi:formiminotetrahydrofolate cyclodeaminase